jgi:hypothetical protein
MVENLVNNTLCYNNQTCLKNIKNIIFHARMQQILLDVNNH